MENDQIQRERVLEKLGKIKALAEKGIGGEKETAMRLYAELCIKYGITEEETDFEEIETRFFTYKTELEEKLLCQIFYKVTGDNTAYGFTGPYKRRKKRGVKCTKLEALEIELLFNFYREQLKKELGIFVGAFIKANNLYPDENARCYEESEDREMSEEEWERYFRMLKMAGNIHAEAPPRAMIEEKEVEQDGAH